MEKKKIGELKKLKAYGGSPCPTPLQLAAEAAWRDEKHVEHNRSQYKEKLNLASKILKSSKTFKIPEAGFFLWLEVTDGETVAIDLWKDFGVKVLPGAYLSNKNHEVFGGNNPGKQFIRVALVQKKNELEFGLNAISQYLKNHGQ